MVLVLSFSVSSSLDFHEGFVVDCIANLFSWTHEITQAWIGRCIFLLISTAGTACHLPLPPCQDSAPTANAHEPHRVPISVAADAEQRLRSAVHCCCPGTTPEALGSKIKLGICWTFSRMRNKGSRFTLGVWGLRMCSLDVAQHNRSQPFVTVRNRSQVSVWGRYGNAYGECCKSVIFEPRFTWQAWHFVTSRHDATCFITCQKLFRVTGANLLRRYQKMSCIFRGRRSTLETSIIILRGERSTLEQSSFVWQAQHFRRVALRVFCELHCQGCIKWWQRANRVAGVGHRASAILRGKSSI